MSAAHNPAHAAHHTAETPPLHDSPDAWHDHSHDTEAPQIPHAEVGNAKMIIGLGLGLFGVVVFASVAVYIYFSWYVAQYKMAIQADTSPNSVSARARADQERALTELHQPGWVLIPAVEGQSEARQVVRLPLEIAAERVAREYARPQARKD